MQPAASSPHLQKKDSQGRQTAGADSNLKHPLKQRLRLKRGSLQAAGQTSCAHDVLFMLQAV